MEYIGIVVGIILFIVGFKMMDVGTTKSIQKDSEVETSPITHYQDLKLREYRSEPNNWTYFFGKVILTIGGVIILFMILFLVGIF